MFTWLNFLVMLLLVLLCPSHSLYKCRMVHLCLLHICISVISEDHSLYVGAQLDFVHVHGIVTCHNSCLNFTAVSPEIAKQSSLQEYLAC